MIDKVYAKYFQKSRSFLYPVLGIERTATFSPTGSFISIPGYIEPEDMKLVVTFKKEESEEFKTFENEMLLGNPLFSNCISVEDYNIYIFNFDIYQKDWFNFILGKYSLLTGTIKKAIKAYYGETSNEFKYMDTYLNPQKYFGVYASLLNVSKNVVSEVGELCDPCDLEKESLTIPIKDLECLTKTV